MSDNEPDYNIRAIKIDDETLYARPIAWSDDTFEKVIKYELVCSRCSQMVHAGPDDLDAAEENIGQIYQNGDDEHILLSQCVDNRGDCPMTTMLATMETPVQEEPDMSDKLKKRAERRAKIQQVKSNPPPVSEKAPAPQTKTPRSAASSDIDVNIDGKDLSANKVDKKKRAKAPPIQPNMETCPFADPTATGELIVMDDRPDPVEIRSEEIPDDE